MKNLYYWEVISAEKNVSKYWIYNFNKKQFEQNRETTATENNYFNTSSTKDERLIEEAAKSIPQSEYLNLYITEDGYNIELDKSYLAKSIRV